MRGRFVALIISFLFVAFASSAFAAPQILGLVASKQPIFLTCKAGVCTAEVTTVCLQEHRRVPVPGRAYKAGPGTVITLTVIDKAGQKQSVSIAKEIAISARRHFTSVHVSLPEKTVRRFGEGAARLSIGALASAVPVAKLSDKAPLTRYEIEKYTGPLREIAEAVFDQDSLTVETTSTLNQVINLLPEGIANDRAQFEKSWAAVMQDKARKLTPAARRAISKIAQTCRHDFRVGKHVTLRVCLEQRHDILASDTNKKVWQALKPGG